MEVKMKSWTKAWLIGKWLCLLLEDQGSCLVFSNGKESQKHIQYPNSKSMSGNL